MFGMTKDQKVFMAYETFFFVFTTVLVASLWCRMH